MRNRLVPVIAAALTAAIASGPAFANDPQSNSYVQAGVTPVVGDEVPEATLGTWIPGATLPVGVVRYAMAQCAGENMFYTISGVTTGGQLTTANQRYNAATNTWATLAPIPAGSEGPTGACVQGKIYVAGGSTTLTTLRIYDIATNAWTLGAPVPRGVVMAHMGVHNNRIYLIGGDSDFQPANGVSNVVNIYDIATNTWLPDGATMPTGAVSGGYAQVGTFVYVVGGWGQTSPAANVNQTQRYDMATNTWTVGPTFTSARADLVTAATGTALYSIGGDNNAGGFFDLAVTVERLDITAWPAGTWTANDNLPTARSGHKGGFCTRSFFPATGEVWSTGGIAAPFPTFSNTNQYLQAEACPGAVSVAAAALEADPTGNRVIEPNEAAAVVAPAWRNTGGAVIASLTGAASAFTGPPGPTYTINDAVASYGSVNAGATASCTTTGNCYAVTATSATRPVLHWDTTMNEVVTPPGTAKVWTLHIGASFSDVSTTSPFYRFIETLLHKGVTGGCGPDTYCPTASTTREQMAVFALIAKEGPAYSPPACVPPNLFADVPETSPFCRFIEELANRGVVAGCGGGNYCPTQAVTREQMSIFMLRTLDPALNPPACVPPNLFLDVPETSAFCRWIEELANRGVVAGCGGGNYCPTQPVTREQMGVFISATFSLLLYGI